MNKKYLIEILIVFLLIAGTSNVKSIQTDETIFNDNFLEQHEQWQKNNPDSLPIWLTPEEQSKIHEIGKTFVPTESPPAPVRQPAEFEPMQGVLIRYPFGISYEIIAEMAEDVEVVTIVASTGEQNYVKSEYRDQGVDLDHCSFLIAPSDSYWTRDYGPWFIFNGNEEQGIVDHIYNRPRPNDDQIPVEYGDWQGIPVYGMNLVHSGGNYMTDGQGIAVSTDLIFDLDENPGLTMEQLEQIAEDYLGITTYHVVPDALGDYIKHIDCWAKFLAPDVIMIIKTSQSHSHYDDFEEAAEYFENQTSCYGTPYKVERVYTHMSEPYINCLILDDKVLVPITGSQWDDDAIDSFEAAMPGYEVLGFTGSWASTDALHCRTKGIVDRNMLYIEHTPLSGDHYAHEGYDVQAKIFPYSEEDIIPGSTGVYWMVEGGSWNFVEMDSLEDNEYHALIPSQQDGTIVNYYIHAEDNSGRSENHPYIGAPWAHSFTAYLDNEAPEKPDIVGPTNGTLETEYNFTFTVSDPDNDDVYLYVDWDDGDVEEWIGLFNSGEEITLNHTFSSEGDYTIKAKVKDVYDEEGLEGLLNINIINIPRTKGYTSIQILKRIIERFPFLGRFLSLSVLYNKLMNI